MGYLVLGITIAGLGISIIFINAVVNVLFSASQIDTSYFGLFLLMAGAYLHLVPCLFLSQSYLIVRIGWELGLRAIFSAAMAYCIVYTATVIR
jgi:hypothetical protein